jgi:hypothetical protein
MRYSDPIIDEIRAVRDAIAQTARWIGSSTTWWAMSNYIRNYEHANGIPPDTMNPQHPDRGWASQHQGPVVHLGFR